MLTCTLESLSNPWTWFTLPSKDNSSSRIGSHLTPYKTNAYECGNVAKCSEENREGKCAKLVAAEGELFVDQTYHLPGEVGSWPPEAQKAVENYHWDHTNTENHILGSSASSLQSQVFFWSNACNFMHLYAIFIFATKRHQVSKRAETAISWDKHPQTCGATCGLAVCKICALAGVLDPQTPHFVYFVQWGGLFYMDGVLNTVVYTL